MSSSRTAISIDCRLGAGDERSLHFDVRDGLHRPFKELPPKHFYDAEGSRLFEVICSLPEYYPTSAERSIIDAHAQRLVASTGVTELVELGSGVPTKTRLLLDAMASAGTLERYVPFDVSETVVRASAEQLVEEYDGLRVHGIVGDYERHLDAVPEAEGTRIVVFLGGTLGNFLAGARRRFLRSVARQLRPEDRLLLGTDLVKDPRVLERAYDDSQGVTAAFNRNVLTVINRELDADFDPAAFAHVAFYDSQHEWIEMRLRAERPQVVRIEALDLTVHFAHREEMRTEISAKFARERLAANLAASGMVLEEFLTDEQSHFALSVCAPLH